jgi:ketosteroid isomerase-like protein
MGEARMVMDQATDAAFKGDWSTLERLYAPDAVAVTPDQGELKGRDEIVQYLKSFVDSMPDGKYTKEYGHESGNTAIDEGFVDGTNTGSLPLPTGETLPATGKRVHVRGCDVVTVENGMITSHRFYFDQMEFLGQLGLLPEMQMPS